MPPVTGGAAAGDSLSRTTSTTWDEDVLDAPGAVLVDFWAPWCGTCTALTPLLEELQRTHGHRIRVTKVDVQAHPDLALRYRVTSLPSVKFFVDGDLRGSINGAITRSALDEAVTSHFG
ncbi:thioredoxin family protein [Microbacterium sediminicola]|uniref:thioredoxin family protein n=1 Tax=Microbacterium sediminicola TaxID=415210 RepID=UPI0031E2E6DD